MQKLKLLLFTLFLSGLVLGVNAQDTIRSLIISETRTGGRFDHYIELANVGTETVDLSKFTIAWVNNGHKFELVDGHFRTLEGYGEDRQYRLSGTLAPYETWTMMNVGDNLGSDGMPYHRLDIMAKADLLIHGSNSTGFIDYAIPEWEIWGFDSTDVFYNLGYNEGKIGYVIYNHLDNGDSIMIDQYNLHLDANLEKTKEYVDVAGIPGATGTHTFARKATIKQGNMDWESSKGETAEDSEWICIPNHPYERSFTTFGVHGDFQVSLESSVVDIDKPNAKLTVPWGVYKGDSILNLMTVGPGQGWEYVEDSSIIDSTHTIIQNGDVLRMYATGNVLERIDFALTVMDPSSDQAEVFPMRVKRFDEDNPDGYWSQPYYATDGEPVIDTIGNVAYATRVDSLFKYMEKAPLANWEIVWKDGVVRADLQNGDILKVTAEDGTTIKEYYIDVQDYVLSDNVNLAAITWPEKSEYIDDWSGDTIPQFDSEKNQYSVRVPFGINNVPALVAYPADINSQVSVKRAVSLFGSLEERSTVFTVTSESDTLDKKYTVIFEAEKDPVKVQIYKGTPFISEMLLRFNSSMGWLEIVNPGNVDLDLSEYLIVRSESPNPSDALLDLHQDPLQVNEGDHEDMYKGYVPGYKYHHDTATWLLEPGILSIDGNINPTVKPGDVFVLCATASDRKRYYTPELLAKIDQRWDGVERTSNDPLGINVKSTPSYLLQGANGIYLFHIDNDSVLEGKKPVGDPTDYTLVDVFADPIADGAFNVAGLDIGSRHKGRVRPKPHVYTGARSVVESVERFGTTAEDSDWIAETYTVDFENPEFPVYVGSHLMDPVTVYLSTVSSPVYLVSDGYGEGESIKGDLTSTSVEQFKDNLEEADSAQVLSIHSGVDGSVKSGTDAVVGTDTLVVISADGLSTTWYALVDSPLDSDAILTLVDNPSDYAIDINEATGTITGVEYGSALKDIVNAVNVPDLAFMNIIDGEGELIPLLKKNNKLAKVDTKVGDDVYFEVVAQDRVTVITYKLEPSVLSSDAFVISTIYDVDQEKDVIDGLYDGTSTKLLDMNIEVVAGATATLLNKLGHERTDGLVAYDDLLQVVSEDSTVTRTYSLTFVKNLVSEINHAPEVLLAFSDTAIAEIGTILLSATVTDDGLPLPELLIHKWEVTAGNSKYVVIETADQATTNATFSVEGTFAITLSVSDGSATTKEVVNVTVGNVGIGETLSPSMHVYPNPASERLTLELINMPEDNVAVTIFSIMGSAIYNEKLSAEKTEINISGFDSGLYFIRVGSGKQSFTKMIEIQK